MRPRLHSWFDALFHRSSLEQRLVCELEAHMAEYTDDLVRSGLPRPEAERRARLEFGALESMKEECRAARGLRWPDQLRQDLRYAFRALRRAPGFTTAAVLSLALGIGLNTTIFSVLNAALLRRLPYADPDRLVAVYENHVTRNAPCEDFANANFADLRSSSPSFEDLAAHMSTSAILDAGRQAERLEGRRVTANLFALLGTGARLGRTFRPEEGRAGGPHVIVLSHGLWMDKFGADPGILGRTLRLDGTAFTVIGVMPLSFRLPGERDEFWTPLALDTREWQERSNHNLGGFGRLKPGATLARARMEASVLAGRLQRQFPDDNAGVGFSLVPLRDALTHRVRGALLALQGATFLLLLIASVNVGNLILARAAARRREFVLRTALGAGRLRLMWQVLTEGMLLSLLGGGAALGLCLGSLALLRASLPEEFIPAGEIGIDAGVLWFCLAASVVSGLLSALVPACFMARQDPQPALAASSRSSTGSGAELKLRGWLVAGEVALTLMLLLGAGLLLRSFARLAQVDPGFERQHVLAARFELPWASYATPEKRAVFYRRLLEQSASLPGVESASLITSLPLTSEGGSSWFLREDRPSPRPEELLASNRLVSEDYFRTLRIPLRRGRTFSALDGPNAPLVAVINESMARRFWPGENPVGKRFQFIEKPWVEIVGVVGDVHQAGLDLKPAPEIYRPVAQDTQDWLAPRALVVRTHGDPGALSPAARRLFQDLDRGVAIYGLNTLDSLLDKSMTARWLELILLCAFGAAALLLACIGIYGVVAYVVAQRQPEIGVRMALGATGSAVVLLMLRRGMRPVTAGLVLGLVLAYPFARSLAALLFEVKPGDALAFAGAPAVLLLVSGLAAYLPSRRAARLDPVVALRQE